MSTYGYETDYGFIPLDDCLRFLQEPVDGRTTRGKNVNRLRSQLDVGIHALMEVAWYAGMNSPKELFK